MTLDSVLSQFGIQRHNPHSVEAQLHAMRREVRRIGKSLSHQLAHNTDEWGDHLTDMGRDAARNTAHFAEIAGGQAIRGARMVQRDPLPAIALVGTTLLLVSLFRRR